MTLHGSKYTHAKAKVSHLILHAHKPAHAGAHKNIWSSEKTVEEFTSFIIKSINKNVC